MLKQFCLRVGFVARTAGILGYSVKGDSELCHLPDCILTGISVSHSVICNISFDIVDANAFYCCCLFYIGGSE